MADNEMSMRASMDVEDVTSGLSAILDAMSDLVDKLVNIAVTADTDVIDEVQRDLEAIDNMLVDADIVVNENALTIIDTVENDLIALDSMVATADIDVNSGTANSEVDSVIGKLETIPDTVTTEIQAAVKGFGDMEDLIAEMERVDGYQSEMTIIAIAEDDASPVLADIEASADELDGRDINLEINAQGLDETVTGLEEADLAGQGFLDTLLAIVATAAGLKVEQQVQDLNLALEKTVYYGKGTNETFDRLMEQARDMQTASHPVLDIANAQLQLTKATGDANTSMAMMEGIMNYVKVAGADLTLTVNTAADIMQKFGLSAEETTDALTYMAAASTQTKMSGDEMASIIDRLSGDFVQMGLSIQDATNLVWAFDKSGVRSREIMMGMRSGFTYFIEALDESSPNFEKTTGALNQLGVQMYDSEGKMRSVGDIAMDAADKLSKMADGPEKTRLALDVFGPSAKKTFAILKTSPADAAKSFGDSSEKIVKDTRKINVEHLSLQQKLNKLWAWAISYLPKLVAQIGVSLLLAFGVFTAVFGKAIPKILRSLDAEWGHGWETSYKNFMDKIAKGTKNIFKTGMDSLRNWRNWGRPAREGTESITKSLTGDFKGEGFINKIKGFGESVLRVIRNWRPEWSKPASEATIDLVRNADGSFSSKAPGFIEKLYWFGRSIPERFLSGFNSIKTLPNINNWLNALKNLFTSIKIPVPKIPSINLGGFLDAGALATVGKLVGKLAIVLTIVTSVFDGAWNASDYFNDSMANSILRLSGFISLLHAVGLGDFAETLQRFFRSTIPSSKMLSTWIFGEWFTKQIQDFDTKVQDFTRNIGKWKLPEDPFAGITESITSFFLNFDLKLADDPFGLGKAFNFSDLNIKMQKFWDSVIGSVNNFFGGIPKLFDANIWKDNLTKFFSVEGITNYLTLSFDNILRTIMNFGNSMVAGITNINWYSIGAGLVQALTDMLNNFASFVEYLYTLPNQISTALTGFGDAFWNAINGAGAYITGAFENTKKSFNDFLVWHKKWKEDSWKNAQEWANGIVPYLQGAWSNTGKWLNNIVAEYMKYRESVKKWREGVWAELVKFGQNLWNGLMNLPKTASKWLDDTKNRFYKFLDDAKKWPGQAYNSAKNFLDNLIKPIKEGVAKVDKALKDNWKKFTDFLNNIASLPGKLYTAAQKAFDGFIKGITDKMPGLTTALARVRALFPFSPPKTGPLIDIMDWGGNIVEAISSGLSKDFPIIQKQFTDNLKGLKNKITGFTINLDTIKVSGDLDLPDTMVSKINDNQGVITTEKKISITIDIKTDNPMNDPEIKETGDRIAQQVTDQLGWELSGKGITKFDINQI